MSGYKVKKGVNTVAKVIAYIVVILLIIGLAGVVLYLFTRPQGMYVRYGETTIADSGKSIVLFEGEDVANFVVEHNGGWDEYSVQDCTVTVIPYASESQNFVFNVAGESFSRFFNDEENLTAAFVDSGNEITLGEDGTFELSFKCKDMVAVLETVYGKDNVSLTGYPDISAYPYFALQIVSPDGKEKLIVPFRCFYTIPSSVVDSIELDQTGVII